MKLRVGKIPYLNLYPIFQALQDEADCSDYEFVEDFPSSLNRMLRQGEIDVSPSSSIEYLRGEGSYNILDGHSISSTGPVRSIQFISRVPVTELDGEEVYVTDQSETSVALLDIILRKTFGVECKMSAIGKPLADALSERPAMLLIGDAALRAIGAGTTETDERGARGLNVEGRAHYAYDLGELWHELSEGKPFVYALWIYRKDIDEDKARLIKKFSVDLARARDAAPARFGELAGAAGSFMAPELIKAYWKAISYGFGPEHRGGLELFRGYLQELGLLS